MRKWEVWSYSLQSEFGVSFTVTVVFTSREDIGVVDGDLSLLLRFFWGDSVSLYYFGN